MYGKYLKNISKLLDFEIREIKPRTESAADKEKYKELKGKMQERYLMLLGLQKYDIHIDTTNNFERKIKSANPKSQFILIQRNKRIFYIYQRTKSQQTHTSQRPKP